MSKNGSVSVYVYRLERAMKEWNNNMKQKQLAQKIGKRPATISEWFSEYKKANYSSKFVKSVNKSTFEKLCEVLAVSPDFLTGKSDSPYVPTTKEDRIYSEYDESTKLATTKDHPDLVLKKGKKLVTSKESVIDDRKRYHEELEEEYQPWYAIAEALGYSIRHENGEYLISVPENRKQNILEHLGLPDIDKKYFDSSKTYLHYISKLDKKEISISPEQFCILIAQLKSVFESIVLNTLYAEKSPGVWR